MRRRELIALIGSSVVWPFDARSQPQQPLPVIGLLYVRSPEESAPQLAAFRQGLADR